MFASTFNLNDVLGMLRKSNNITKDVVIDGSKPLEGHFETFKEGVSGVEVMDINQNPKTPAIKIMFVPNISTNVLLLSAGDDRVLTTEKKG